jgi:hypothetical protein
MAKLGSATKQEEGSDEDDLLNEINKGAKDLGGERYPLLYTDGVGEGFVRVMGFTKFKKRLGKVVTFALQLMVVESSCESVKPGAIRSVLEGTDKEAWDKRVSRILMAGIGASKEDLEREGGTLLAQAYSEAQPMVDVIMAYSNVEARDKDGETKCDKDGKPYVNSQFRACNQADWAKLSKIMPEIDPSWKPAAMQPGVGA